ncbi:hypothetical protein HYDPIDRAFT_30619 [Hydnomerulius pinastri MD-312]|uniref:Uncharacterized protein n=1 Tax=Hydnomerulius pinastri MD-312 TaxID=994086 RepID=A0A0C9W5P1_9AGAM|nr:hypothetical protein HYDPIDRAFT_30619 [Hydnomerulius pinastri MD-312]
MPQNTPGHPQSPPEHPSKHPSALTTTRTPQQPPRRPHRHLSTLATSQLPSPLPECSHHLPSRPNTLTAMCVPSPPPEHPQHHPSTFAATHAASPPPECPHHHPPSQNSSLQASLMLGKLSHLHAFTTTYTHMPSPPKHPQRHLSTLIATHAASPPPRIRDVPMTTHPNRLALAWVPTWVEDVEAMIRAAYNKSADNPVWGICCKEFTKKAHETAHAKQELSNTESYIHTPKLEGSSMDVWDIPSGNNQDFDNPTHASWWEFHVAELLIVPGRYHAFMENGMVEQGPPNPDMGTTTSPSMADVTAMWYRVGFTPQQTNVFHDYGMEIANSIIQQDEVEEVSTHGYGVAVVDFMVLHDWIARELTPKTIERDWDYYTCRAAKEGHNNVSRIEALPASRETMLTTGAPLTRSFHDTLINWGTLDSSSPGIVHDANMGDPNNAGSGHDSPSGM